MALTKEQRRLRIKRRIRKIVSGTAERPRLSVYRSNAQMSAQVIDDINGKTIVSVSSLSKEFAGQMSKTEQAEKIGAAIAAKAVAAGIENVVFDRNGYLYHGRVKTLADAARNGGLKF
ncbi:MAG: 50S ribosomal protein L18 [Marinifilaceae bacterium]